jgi:Ni/Co efflux regulator RcnB
MNNNTLRKSGILTMAAALVLSFSLSVLPDKAAWADSGGKSGKHEKKEKHKSKGHDDGYSHESADSHRSDHSGVDVHVYFDDRQRTVIRHYYTEEYRSGHCPPGLAKKNNGCMPPGQAKKWRKGYPLPREVVYYDLPPAIIVELGPPPSGHRYVRVASDILLMAVGTGMIVDAIQDLSDM